MRYIDRVLSQLEDHIHSGSFEALETDRIELKDLSNPRFSEDFYKTVCAFLNTEGGIIIVGIREKDRRYLLTGYDPGTEDNLNRLGEQFCNADGTRLDLRAYFPPPEIRPCMDKRICLVYVEKLPEALKYVYWNSHAYARKLTGDVKIPPHQIARQEDLKRELTDARELSLVPAATVEDLDIDPLNDYILRLNREIKVTSPKADLQAALPFMHTLQFVREQTPTLLGMLVCGRRPYDWIKGRCQVDCFVDAAQQVAQNKLILKDNIIPLMEAAVGFVYKNMAVGVSYAQGGTSLPEYPERLIREVVNNALAHRDYESDGFVNLIIKPDTYIEVRNPGNFRADQRLQMETPVRVRRIIPRTKPRNPRLADILKVYDRWEGRGLGMASLTNACLNNEIDVPYFILRGEDNISLYVPKGQVLDDEARSWLNSFSGWISRQTSGRSLSQEEETVLTYFYKSERHNKQERYTILLTQDNNHFQAITTLENYGLIQRLPIDNQLDVYPLYVINPVLTQVDFYPALRQLFGQAFDILQDEYKNVLEVIYQHNTYSRAGAISAKSADLFLYTRRHKVIKDLRAYDTFSRKVRTIVNTLEKRGFIKKVDAKPSGFVINQDFKLSPTLFTASD
ncbi:MAG: putative DNA binding domain-containing protein [Bacteroidia bacterium]|nr:putative DNA binding domain-containing protein [Bacteroidia bacterium]